MRVGDRIDLHRQRKMKRVAQEDVEREASAGFLPPACQRIAGLVVRAAGYCWPQAFSSFQAHRAAGLET